MRIHRVNFVILVVLGFSKICFADDACDLIKDLRGYVETASDGNQQAKIENMADIQKTLELINKQKISDVNVCDRKNELELKAEVIAKAEEVLSSADGGTLMELYNEQVQERSKKENIIHDVLMVMTKVIVKNKSLGWPRDPVADTEDEDAGGYGSGVSFSKENGHGMELPMKNICPRSAMALESGTWEDMPTKPKFQFYKCGDCSEGKWRDVLSKLKKTYINRINNPMFESSRIKPEDPQDLLSHADECFYRLIIRPMVFEKKPELKQISPTKRSSSSGKK